MAKVNFLSNRELLKEIHLSKNTYSYYTEQQYANYDIIIADRSLLTTELINATRVTKAMRLDRKIREEYKKTHKVKVIPDFEATDPKTIPINGMVVRIMTYEHIPRLEEHELRGNPKKEKDFHHTLNFAPYKHYVIETDIENTEDFDANELVLREVGRSHWRNALENGEFCVTHGRTTDRLGAMYLKLVDKYGQKPNWRGYSYLEEMQAQALIQLSHAGLKFEESKSQNPFAYYTSTMKNSFLRILHEEKKNQLIRDELLMRDGHRPSHARAMDDWHL